MSDEHKAALAEGRDQGRAVRRYLEALEAQQAEAGPQADARIHEEAARRHRSRASPPPTRCSELHLVQERLDLQAELEATESNVDLDELEKDFVGAAGAYSERKGITYAAWREVGVPAAVLEQAGIARTA